LPPEWRSLKYDHLIAEGVNFGLDQFNELIAIGASPQSVQLSINHFYMALKYDWKPQRGFTHGPLKYFMGCLTQTGVFEYANYRSVIAHRKRIEEEQLQRTNTEEIESVVNSLANGQDPFIFFDD
jgi:hypothetical protein